MTDYASESQGDSLVDQFLGQRLEDAGEPAGLRGTVAAQVALHIDQINDRGRQQVRQLKSSSSRRPADAYYADEEIAEDELQSAAASIRTALAISGELVEPIPFERSVSGSLASTAAWAIRSEASRVPRPPTRVSVLEWSLVPIPWVEDTDSTWPSEDAVALANTRELTDNDAEPARVKEPPYENWVQIALLERQRTFASKYPPLPARQILLSTGLEICDGPAPDGSMPLSETAPDLWVHHYHELAPLLDVAHAGKALRSSTGPLASLLRFTDQPGNPHRHRGPGLPPFLLGPRIELVALLELRPETPVLRLALVDDHGPALVCRQWRSFPIHDGDYEPLEPGLHGADLVLRPDLYEIVRAAIGADRLKIGLALTCDPKNRADFEGAVSEVQGHS